MIIKSARRRVAGITSEWTYTWIEPITNNFLGIVSSRIVRNKDNTYYGEIHTLLPVERHLMKTSNYKTRDEARIAVKEFLGDTTPLD